MKNVVITRKIQLLFDVECKEQFIEELNKWKEFQYLVRKASNLISTHAFVQDNITDFVYLTEDIKLKLADIEKDPSGILTTSKQNSTYQMLSNRFKGQIPMSIMACLNSVIAKTYSQEKMDVMTGKKSVRSYRNDVPIPISSKDILSKVKKCDDGNYSISMFDSKFTTFFGRDKSNNKSILDKAFYGLENYKLCDSSIQMEIKGKKIKTFLLAVVSFPQTKKEVNPDKEIHCVLDPNYPIIIKDKRETKIGTLDDFLVPRIYIQKKINEIQKALKYQSGGKGRNNKLKALERFKEKELNFVKNKMHVYSRHLIDYCVNNKIGKIHLDNLKEIQDLKDNNFEQVTSEDDTKKTTNLIRNWSYYGLLEKIVYKATMNGIEVIIDKKETEEKTKKKKSIEKELKTEVELA
jgi:IS605 OrfB family transposase